MNHTPRLYHGCINLPIQTPCIGLYHHTPIQPLTCANTLRKACITDTPEIQKNATRFRRSEAVSPCTPYGGGGLHPTPPPSPSKAEPPTTGPKKSTKRPTTTPATTPTSALGGAS